MALVNMVFVIACVSLSIYLSFPFFLFVNLCVLQPVRNCVCAFYTLFEIKWKFQRKMIYWFGFSTLQTQCLIFFIKSLMSPADCLLMKFNDKQCLALVCILFYHRLKNKCSLISINPKKNCLQIKFKFICGRAIEFGCKCKMFNKMV